MSEGLNDTVYPVVAKIPPSLEDSWIIPIFPEIQKEDIDRGYMIRYFTRQLNQKIGEIFEIDKSTFSRLQNNRLFNAISIQWRITGALDDILGPPHINTPTRIYTGVLTANRLSLEMGEKQLPGMKSKLLNLSQFWQGS